MSILGAMFAGKFYRVFSGLEKIYFWFILRFRPLSTADST